VQINIHIPPQGHQLLHNLSPAFSQSLFPVIFLSCLQCHDDTAIPLIALILLFLYLSSDSSVTSSQKPFLTSQTTADPSYHQGSLPAPLPILHCLQSTYYSLAHLYLHIYLRSQAIYISPSSLNSKLSTPYPQHPE
jgi:hypothetical protein